MMKITTIQQCDDYYYPEKPVINGMPEDTVYPLPAGVPFFLCHLAYDYTDKRNPRRHGLYGTQEVDIRDQRAAYERMRTYEFKHLIPRLGKSINKHSYPVGSVMLIVKVDENGVKHHVPHVCDCGGQYIRSVTGDFFCDKCGVEYSWIADEDNARKTSFFDTLDESDFQDSYSDYYVEDDDADIPFPTTESGDDRPFSLGLCSQYQGEEPLGDTAHPKMRAIHDRVTRNIIAWRAANNIAPVDEVRAHARLHDKVEATIKAKSKIRKDSVYNSRINKVKTSERKALVLHHIKVDDVHTAADITRITGLHRTTVVRLLEAMEADGRLVSIKYGKEKVYQVI